MSKDIDLKIKETNTMVDKTINDIIATRIKKSEEFIIQVIKLMVENDCTVFDINYISAKARQEFEGIFMYMNFNDPEIERLKKEMINRMIDVAQKKLPKFKAVKEKNPTDARNNRCDPIALELVKMVLNKPLVNDEKFLSKVFEENNQKEFDVIVGGYLSTIGDKTGYSVEESFNIVQALLLGNHPNKVTLRQLDKILKEKK